MLASGFVRKLAPFILSLLMACSGSSVSSDLGVSAISQPLPALSGPALVGSAVSPGDYRGKVLVVNFWATWCGPCRREQPALGRVWERFRDRGVYFLGVDTRDDPAAARTYLAEFRVTYPSIQDQAGAYADDFGFIGLPDTYVVDRSGTMRYRVTGAIDENELEKLVERLLGSSA